MTTTLAQDHADTYTDQNSLHRRNAKISEPPETVVATIWLAFYVLAIVIAITSPLVLRAIEIAARCLRSSARQFAAHLTRFTPSRPEHMGASVNKGSSRE